MREQLAALFYAWDIKITAKKTEAEPKTQILKLTKGVIRGVDVVFPAGCHRLVKVRLFRYESQLVPLSRDEWLTGDGETVPTEPYYELDEAPYQLKFVGCAPTTAYDHTVTVRVRIEPLEVAAPWRVLADFVSILKKLMGID